jgi:putative salt-induced outer membrane protein
MRTLCALAFLTLTAPLLAQAPAPADPLVGSASLGYLSTSGNTESTNANASFEATWDLDGPWTHDWTALAINARTDDITTAESYAAGYKAQRDFSEASYLFFSADWRQDRFSGYDQQVSEAIGYGRRLIDNERHMLALEGGAGAKQSDLSLARSSTKRSSAARSIICSPSARTRSSVRSSSSSKVTRTATRNRRRR